MKKYEFNILNLIMINLIKLKIQFKYQNLFILNFELII